MTNFLISNTIRAAAVLTNKMEKGVVLVYMFMFFQMKNFFFLFGFWNGSSHRFVNMVARYLIAKGREKDSLSLLGWLQNQPVSFFLFFTVQQLERRRRLRLPKHTRSFPF